MGDCEVTRVIVRSDEEFKRNVNGPSIVINTTIGALRMKKKVVNAIIELY